MLTYAEIYVVAFAHTRTKPDTEDLNPLALPYDLFVFPRPTCRGSGTM
jgi:hypothetical protein